MAQKDDIEELRSQVAALTAAHQSQADELAATKAALKATRDVLAEGPTAGVDRAKAEAIAARKAHLAKQLEIREKTAKENGGKTAVYRVPFGTYDNDVLYERGAIIRLPIERIPGSTFEPVVLTKGEAKFEAVGAAPVQGNPAAVAAANVPAPDTADRPSDQSVLS